MIRRAILIVIVLACAGCELFQPAYSPEWQAKPPVVELEQVIYWLETADSYMQLSPEKAQQRLERIQDAGKGSDVQLFRYALLNQQRLNRNGWVRARDAFRELSTRSSLNAEIQWLARILLAYNQAMINRDDRQDKLTRALGESNAARMKLEAKIEALTNLEESISIRKGLAEEIQDETGQREIDRNKPNNE